MRIRQMTKYEKLRYIVDDIMYSVGDTIEMIANTKPARNVASFMERSVHKTATSFKNRVKPTPLFNDYCLSYSAEEISDTIHISHHLYDFLDSYKENPDVLKYMRMAIAIEDISEEELDLFYGRSPLAARIGSRVADILITETLGIESRNRLVDNLTNRFQSIETVYYVQQRYIYESLYEAMMSNPNAAIEDIEESAYQRLIKHVGIESDSED